MGIHKVETALDGRLVDNRIGIEQQNVFSIRHADGLIICTCKTNIRLVGNEMYLLIFGAQLLDRMVSRAIIYHVYVALNTIMGPLNTLQTFVKQLTNVVADNNYTDFLGHTNGMQSSRMTPK
jgi:hypothetical protein